MSSLVDPLQDLEDPTVAKATKAMIGPPPGAKVKRKQEAEPNILALQFALFPKASEPCCNHFSQ